MQRGRHVRGLAVLGALTLLAAACGGSSSSSTSKTTAASGAAPKSLAAAPGFDPVSGTIHLGVISPLTGPASIIGIPLTSGNEVYFDYVNSQGGIGGHYKVKLDEEDSQYTPQLAVQGYNTIKGGDVLIQQLLGTPETNAVLPLLKSDGLVAAPASLDSQWVREPNLIPIGGPYQIQMINASDYAINTLGLKGKTFCSLIQDDTYGQAGQQGIDYAGQSLGFSMKTTAKYSAGATDMTAQVQQLKSSGCEVVFLVDTPDITGQVFTKSVQLQFNPQWIGQSPSYVGALAASPLAPYMEAHYLVVGEGPQWGDTSVPGMSAMLNNINQFKPNQKPDGFFGFGYAQAEAVAQILTKAVQLGDLSRQGIMKAMTQVGTLTFQGLLGDYFYGTSAADRNPPRASSMFKVVPTVPTGLQALKTNFTTTLAQNYKIPAA